MSSKAKRVIDLLPTSSEWEWLSVVPEKRDAFSKDLYFRDCWMDVARTFGVCTMGLLHSIAVLTIKPDAVVGRRMARILEFVMGHRFLPIAVASLHLTRHSMRELWRYDWHVYPVDRLAFSTLWYTSTEIPVIVLQDLQPQGSIPASVRLSELKGSAAPENRTDGDLRTLLNPPNRMLNFVHVAEEPIDVVRELGIFFDRTNRGALLTEIKDNVGVDRHRDVLDEIARIEVCYPKHDLDFSLSLKRLEESAAVTQIAAGRLKRLFSSGTKIGWDELCSMVDYRDGNICQWDFICVASSLIRLEREVRSASFTGVVIDKWAALPARPELGSMRSTTSQVGDTC